MTRPILLFLCMILALGLIACERTAPQGETTSTSATPPDSQRLRIGISIPAATHGWPAGVIWWAEQTIQQYPDIQWTFQQASRATDQASHIEAMLQKGIDALVVLPFDSDTPLPAITEAKRRGVFIVSVDRGLRQPVADLYVAGDNRAYGRKSGEYVAEKLGGKGDIVVLRGLPVEIDAERYEGFMEVIAHHPEIRVLGTQPGNWNQQDAYRVMQGFLTQHPRIDAVWASDDDMALGVEKAIQDAGRSDGIWVLGGAGMKEIVRRVRDHDPLFPADITYPPGMIAAGIHAGVAAMRPEHREQIVRAIPDHLGMDEAAFLEQITEAVESDEQQVATFDVHLITPENATEYYFPESPY